MSEGTPAPAAAPTPPAKQEQESTHVIVRSYPKVVYLYLTWLAAIIIGFLHPEATAIEMSANKDVTDPGIMYSAEAVAKGLTLGRIWFFIFVLNILVIAFEFSRMRSVALAGILAAVFFAGIHFGWLTPLVDFFGGLNILMSKGFYYSFAAVFSVMYLLVFINTRFSYWEIQPNEILHHHGFMGDVDRFPTRGLRMRKEISDVFEYVLLRSGTLVLSPTGVERPIVLDNVIGLNKVEDKIQRLLGTLKVRIDTGQVGGID